MHPQKYHSAGTLYDVRMDVTGHILRRNCRDLRSAGDQSAKIPATNSQDDAPYTPDEIPYLPIKIYSSGTNSCGGLIRDTRQNLSQDPSQEEQPSQPSHTAHSDSSQPCESDIWNSLKVSTFHYYYCSGTLTNTICSCSKLVQL